MAAPRRNDFFLRDMARMPAGLANVWAFPLYSCLKIPSMAKENQGEKMKLKECGAPHVIYRAWPDGPQSLEVLCVYDIQQHRCRALLRDVVFLGSNSPQSKLQ